MKKLNNHGVSLVELLAVIVIMGIIAGIAVPLVGTIIDNTKKDAFKADAVAVCEAVRTYAMIEGIDGTSIGEDGVITLITGSGETAEDAASIETYLSKTFDSIAKEIKVAIDDMNNVTIYMENDKYKLGEDSSLVDPTTAEVTDAGQAASSEIE